MLVIILFVFEFKTRTPVNTSITELGKIFLPITMRAP